MKRDKRQQTQKHNGQTKSSAGSTLKCDTCGKPHKAEDCWNASNAANDPRPSRHFQLERKTDHTAQPVTTKPVEEPKK